MKSVGGIVFLVIIFLFENIVKKMDFNVSFVWELWKKIEIYDSFFHFFLICDLGFLYKLIL